MRRVFTPTHEYLVDTLTLRGQQLRRLSASSLFMCICWCTRRAVIFMSGSIHCKKTKKKKTKAKEQRVILETFPVTCVSAGLFIGVFLCSF